MASGLYNGFAAPIERRWPQIHVLRERLLTLGAANALMTGSGAAVFGIFANQAASDAAAAQLTTEGYWAAAVCPVGTGLARVHG
jgi:4-diphosphocytidyl-2-C-methyl-D-erythritol kinase